MNEEDFKQLELLLGKFQQHIRHRICIVPGIIFDGCHVGIYDKIGNLKYSSNQMGIKECADDIIEKYPIGEKAN